MKQCTKCLEFKDESEFHKQKSARGGLKPRCKTCRAGIARQYYQQPGVAERQIQSQKIRMKQPEALENKRRWRREYQQKWRDENPDVRKLREAISRAINRAIKHGDLSHISTQLCEDCGKQAEHYHHWSYEKEYWLDVVPLCARCHKVRHLASKEQANE